MKPLHNIKFWSIISLNLSSQSCQTKPILFNINSNESIYYPFTVSVNKCGGSCNTIVDPYAQVFVSDKIKSMNVKVFNLMSGVNETRFLVQHEACKNENVD